MTFRARSASGWRTASAALDPGAASFVAEPGSLMEWRGRQVRLLDLSPRRTPSGELVKIAHIEVEPGKPTRYVFSSELT